MEHPAQIEEGYYLAPEEPGAGMTPSSKALAEINKV
jgi:L-alanine-DL-glutamate epimerase-like enolase superfamily enzyme